jgi:argininosuccinate lyase
MKVLRKAFKQELDAAVSNFVNSIDTDAHLVQADIKGSKAHAQMLAQSGLMDQACAEAIAGGLNEIAAEHAAGKFALKVEFEDVHMNVEKTLEAKVGEPAGRLHTARSRNDQVALDARLYTASKIEELAKLIVQLQLKLIEKAEKNLDVLMPGYTHLQRAQPVLFAHAMHAFVEMLARDYDRLADCLKRTEISPLGAGALAGTSLPIDPQLSAKLLGFNQTFKNSLDAVSDRDFAVEFLSACCICSTHLSQLAETLMIWASSEFGFVKFDDNVTTASSLMPNKKNPDPVELVRGKTGAVVGDLVNLLVTLKALPLGYNRDLQETKPPIVNAAKIISESLTVMGVVIEATAVQKEVTLAAASDPYLAATDLAEYLVRKGVPFRQAHEAVSEFVTFAREQNKPLHTLPLAELKNFAAEFDNDVFALFDPETSVSAKVSPGSTGTASVKGALASARVYLESRELRRP